MNRHVTLIFALVPLCLAATAAFADNPAWYAGKYYDPDNPDSSTGFTTGYKLYRTIGCPGRSLLAKPCAVPPPPEAPVAKAAEPAPAPKPAPVAEMTPPPKPAPAPVVEAPKPVPVIAKEKPLVLKDVNFRFNHYNLMPAAYPILDHAAADLKREGYPMVKVDGYTDIIGTVKYNLWLSEKRAESVKAYLVKEGVPANTLATEGFGKSHFLASNSTPAGRFENRRVELHIE